MSRFSKPVNELRIVEWPTISISIGVLLVGHGVFQAFQHKEMLLAHWTAIGLPPGDIDPLRFMIAVGWFAVEPVQVQA